MHETGWQTVPNRAFVWFHLGRVTHIRLSKLAIIGSDNGLSSGHRKAIIWTNDQILLIGALRTNFSEILIEIKAFSFWKQNRLNVSSAKRRPFFLGLSDLKMHWAHHWRGVVLFDFTYCLQGYFGAVVDWVISDDSLKNMVFKYT